MREATLLREAQASLTPLTSLTAVTNAQKAKGRRPWGDVVSRGGEALDLRLTELGSEPKLAKSKNLGLVFLHHC